MTTSLPTQVHDSTVNLAGRDQYNANNQTFIDNAYPQGEHLPHAHSSPFNCRDRVKCLEGTRANILDQIFRWIGIRDSQPFCDPVQDRDANTFSADTCVFWINGSAGTGKSTIAYTVAEVCRAHGVLGASFFCSRDDADCSNPNLIFTTIAYQLGVFSPLFRAKVAHVMKSNPDIGYTTPPYQLEELIVKPLRTLRNSMSPCVVVVDALDECKEAGTTSVILSSLSRHVNELFPVKFLMTSRPETHITNVFKSSQLDPVTRRCVLHEVELGIVQTDIEHYLSTKLALTREFYHLEMEWPSAEDIHALARKSFGLFIFASTSVRFVEDWNHCDPKSQLGRLLCDVPTATEDSSPHYHLDRLYDQVLNNAFPNISSTLSDRLKMILGTIVLLRDPLSSAALERLLGVPSRTVGLTLRRLHSVIMVPDNDSLVIRTLHPSFFDFITSPARCHNPIFLVNPRSQHTLLAYACLDVMKGLKRDICGIRNPSILNNEVDDLSSRIMRCIPPELQYACRHWAWHLSNAMLPDVLVGLVKEFCLKHLLYWVEALSLMGDLRNGLLALDAAKQAIAKAGGDVQDTMILLRDCERFTLEFFSIISTCSLQVYHSALLFTPQEALIKKVYRRELDIPIKVYNGLDKRWNSCIRTIEGHSGSVRSVAYSPDGTRIVSGSSDNTVRLWDAVSGAHLNTFMGHSDWVNSVAFSPDGTRILSGSDDRTVYLWDAVSGAYLNTFMGHSHPITSVAVSPDGTRIISGSHDRTARLWDAVGGAHLRTLVGHSGAVRSVAFSPDGMRIVSGSSDCTVRLWDTASGAHLNTLRGHSQSVTSVAFSPNANGAHMDTFNGHSDPVNSVAFSPDGAYIISGSDDQTVRLWDTITVLLLNTFTSHSDRIRSVTFSPDGTRIVSGSSDKTVCLWDAVSGAHLGAFEGRSQRVNSVAISPDGTLIISGSDDSTVQVWDAFSGAHLNTFNGHSQSVTSVAVSPDGMHIISGSDDRTVRVWDAFSGAHLNTFTGHSQSVTSVAVSPDGTRIISGSEDRTVRVWDAVSGTRLTTFNRHFDTVSSVAFSPDGTLIVSGSFDNTVRLWDAVSGAHLDTFRHSNSVYSVAFSPDGTRIISRSDNTPWLWNVHLKTFEGEFTHVKSIARSGSLSQAQDSSSTDGLNSTSPILGYIAADGWAHSLTLNRRICWFPVSLRPNSLAVNGACAAFVTKDGRFINLDFTGMEAYFRNL